MPQRTFSDANGVEWDVYDMISLPGFGRPGAPQIAPHSEVFRAGSAWLAFESRAEKRRLSPIPDGWENASVQELQQLLARARKTTP